MNAAPASCDVALVGLGPVGATLANLLGMAGLSVCCFERERTVYHLARAGHFDDEVLRVFQAIGLAEPITAAAMVNRGMRFVNQDGRLLIDWPRPQVEGPQAWHPSWRFFQPALEATLRDGLARYDNVAVRLGTEVERIEDGTLSWRDMASGMAGVTRAGWIVGCDGGRSLARRTAEIELEDLGVHDRWLVVDLDLREPVSALRRALPIQRLIGNGMDYADAVALHAMVEAGVDWAQAAEALGDATLVRGQQAREAGRTRTAGSLFRHASACFRFAQSAIDADTDEKRRLYGRALEWFGAASAWDDPPTEHVAIPWRDTALCGWLARPPGTGDAAPVVIIFGGADGWKEEYHLGALHLLERGIGCLLLDGPGQGESRLFRGAFLIEPPESALSTAVSWLLERAARVGIWGNSLGGSFAALTASGDPRIAACCVNSGSAVPNEAFKRFPRMREKRFAMIGRRDDAFAETLFERITLPPARNRIACPLLQLHGAPDALFTLEEARPIYDAAPTDDKTLVVWEDGDHCLYNRSHEKHCLIADWFAEKLMASPTQIGRGHNGT